jgi:hypothetical protein
MWTNDEDLELFLKEFIDILNKYHYTISVFSLKKITPPDYYVSGFSADTNPGKFTTMYVTKEVYHEVYPEE